MNAAFAANFALFTETLRKATAVPLAGDFLEWCDETGEFPKIRWSLSMLNVRFNLSDTLPDLRARIQRFEEREIRNQFAKHWSFDANRLATWRQILRAIDKYQEIAR